MELIRFMFSGFWIFVGFALIISGILKLIVIIYKIPFRHLNIRKAGWPPSHLDADGDFKSDNKEDIGG